ncbi:hypothetical protein JB92DRAFT_2854261 [Gautieria morchelliformis]|nr:hypothetical protein JB92DRAFT_2854261 [Gautieria morchelliformis]
MSPKIAILPEASRSTLRSTTILTSLPQIVFELVQNSLDAGASQVDVGVDIEAWHCWVRDDGHGMEAAGMSVLAKGGESGRYGSSKAYDSESLEYVSTFGFRGEALSSSADISCLEICSRTAASRETWSVILKGGKKLYYGPAVRWRREKPGTTVCIRDAFYNLPIRRRSHPNSAKTLDLIRKDLESVSLVFPNVAFSFENSAKEKNEGTGKGRILTIPKTSSSLSAFRHIFGRALCEHVEDINVGMDNMRIQGFLSLDGAQSKAYQYLYVNRHPLSPCELHRAIDTRFAASSFGKHAFDETGETRTPRSTVRRSPRKNERRPVFVLNISAPPRHIDNCLEPSKSAIHIQNLDVVSHFLSTVIQDFLVRHGFSSVGRNMNARKCSDSPSPRKKRKVVHRDPRPDIPAVAVTPPTSDIKSIELSRPSSANSRQEMQAAVLSVDPSADGGRELEWVDPLSGQLYKVDSKTGNSYRAHADRKEEDIVDHGENHDKRRGLVDTSRLRRRSNICSEEEEVPNWIQNALEGWQNPTFGLQDPGIPTMTSISSSSRRPWLEPHLEPEQRPNRQTHFFDANLAAGKRYNADDASLSFSREQLKCARVIGQIDKKFVACLVDDGNNGHGTGSRTLVLVDQHAADERIRVEQFLSEVCKGFLQHGSSGRVETMELKPAAPLLLTRLEARILAHSEGYRHAFERWGFRFAPMNHALAGPAEEGAGDEYLQVLVEAVPDVVSEKLLVADELREVVKGFLARLEVDGVACQPPTSSDAHWTTALRWCPRELLDLINSKACRGAIMFNDPLDIDQCRRLIFQLSNTVWPFICAHGRPSLVPLTNMEWSGRKHKSIIWHRLK